MIAVVRAETVPLARARVASSLARFVGHERGERFGKRVRVILGDLASSGTYDTPLFDAATHVVHAAACTSFESTREVWRTNVVGTTLLAERMRGTRGLARFLHVSSAYCCGDRPCPTVHEDDAPRAEHGYVNEYTRTKAEAERRLLALVADLPVIIARPSVVIGHTKLGVGPSPSLFWYYRALAALGRGPFSLASLRDIVPVDYVADALSFLLTCKAPRYRTYHVSAGSVAAVTVQQIVVSLGGAIGWAVVGPGDLGRARGDLARVIPASDDATRLARGVSACAKFGALGVAYFDNGRLLSEGFRSPPRFTDYLPRCIATVEGRSIYQQMLHDA